MSNDSVKPDNITWVVLEFKKMPHFMARVYLFELHVGIM